MTASERPDPARLAALTRLARDVRPPSGAELDQGFEAMRARVVSGRSRARRRRRLTAFALLPACLLLGALVFWRVRGHSVGSERSIAVARVVGGQILEGGYFSEIGGRGVRLDFDEGSRFELAPGTRGRLRSVTAQGAGLVLDRGTASLRITPNPKHHWSVEAGPFVVSVRGTDFTVAWEPTREELELRLRQGRVAVSGPIVGEELVLRPGQTLTVNLPRRETLITDGRDDRPAGASSTVPAVAPSEVPSASALASPTAAPSALSREVPAVKPAHHFREALAKGQWDAIIAEAERDGLETSLKTLSNEELFALADAARYRHRPDLAREALLAARARFPDSPRALDALFLLGRVEELRADGKIAAIQRYDAYLARAPAGTYSAEALGRKMILVKESQGPEQARRIASEYLLRFPNGSYAEAARSLQQSP